MRMRVQSFGPLNKITWDSETEQITLYFELVSQNTDVVHLIAFSDVQAICWGKYIFNVVPFTLEETPLPIDYDGSSRMFSVVSAKIVDPSIEIVASDASVSHPDDVSLKVATGEILLYPPKTTEESMQSSR